MVEREYKRNCDTCQKVRVCKPYRFKLENGEEDIAFLCKKCASNNDSGKVGK
ncbi:unnamed protein product [marine sediment metagenome]|uniref:Uncharacterized protein n=1 Tax=marine sediment metagenome TaxID=412755 RepID=X0VQV5_9ZZZZ